MNLKTLKSTLLLFLTGIIITSCELQEEAIHQHEHNSNVKLYEMKLEELMTNQRFVTSFSKLPKRETSLTTAALSRTVMENEYGFTIANKPAKVIEDNGETSYTFLITRDSTNADSFENLVIQTDSTNTTKAVIIKYNLTSPITSSADDSYSFTYNREITPIVYNNTTVSETSKMVIVCHWLYVLVCNNGRTGGIGPEHIAGPNCTRTYYNWSQECYSFDDGSPNGGGGGSSYNGGSGGTGGVNSINTSPVNNSIEFSETVSNFLQSLTPNQLEYWDDLSPREQKIIVDYLEQPGADVIFVKELIDLAYNEEDEELVPNLINLSIVTKQNGYFENSFDSNYYDLINPYTEVDTQMHNPLWTVYFTTQCAIARYKLSQEPGWNNLHPWVQDAKVYWEASKEMLHLGLDLIGLVPVVGEVADLTNGIIYTIEGDGVNATLSFASTIPVAGWFSAGIKFAKRADGLAYTVKAANNLISFGAYNSKKFRAALGLLPGDPRQAHHLIPRGLQIINHAAVQKAAKATTNQGFHIDQALNGIAVATWRNQPNHNNYNNLIKAKLDAIPTNLTANQTYAELMDILNQAKQAVINNPNTHLNDLIF